MKQNIQHGVAAIFAAIMILSVIAMSVTAVGPVAAQQADDRSPTNPTVQPGGSVDVTVQFSSNEENIELYSEEIISGSGIATITDATSDAAQGVPSDDGNSAQALYALSPVDSDTFTVTVEVAESASDGDTIELSGTIVDSDGGETDTGTTTITVEEATAGPFTLSNLNPSEATTEPGEQLAVSATVLNTGSAAGDVSVNLTIDGETVDTQQVTNLDASDNANVELAAQAPDSPGTYTYTIETADDQITGQLEVANIGPFTLSNLNPSEVTTGPGEQLAVSATVLNTGSAAGDVSVNLTIDGETVDTQQVTNLDASDNANVELAAQAPDSPGTYTYTVETADDQTTGQLEVGATSFEVEQLSPVSETVSQGESIDVSAQITNSGNIAGESTVEVRAGDTTIAQQSITLDPDESRQFTLLDIDTSELNPDTYPLVVETGDDSSSPGTLTIENSVVTYQDDAGGVETTSLLDALDDWRGDDISAQLLLDVLDEWRASR